MKRITSEIAAFVAEIQSILPNVKITGSLSLLAFGVLEHSRKIGDLDFCIESFSPSDVSRLEKEGFAFFDSYYTFDESDDFKFFVEKNGIKADFFKCKVKFASINSGGIEGDYAYPIYSIDAKRRYVKHFESLDELSSAELWALNKHRFDIEYFLKHSNGISL